MSARGLPGNRVEANRAGMTATTCNGRVKSTLEPVDTGCTANHSTVVLRSPASPMRLKRIFAFVAIAGGLAALATSAATTGRRRVYTPVVTPSRNHGAELSGAALAQEIHRLRERLRPTTVPQQPLRNLFEYDSSRAARSAAPLMSESGASIPVSPQPAPRPSMELIGIAEESEGDRVVRTAIISGEGELFLVKEGETVTARFRVERISAGVVELSDRENAAPVRLALK